MGPVSGRRDSTTVAGPRLQQRKGAAIKRSKGSGRPALTSFSAAITQTSNQLPGPARYRHRHVVADARLRVSRIPLRPTCVPSEPRSRLPLAIRFPAVKGGPRPTSSVSWNQTIPGPTETLSRATPSTYMSVLSSIQHCSRRSTQSSGLGRHPRSKPPALAQRPSRTPDLRPMAMTPRSTTHQGRWGVRSPLAPDK